MTAWRKLKWTDLILPVVVFALAIGYYYYIMNYPMDKMTADYVTPQLVSSRVKGHLYLILVSASLAIGTAVPLGIILTRAPFKKICPFVVGIVNIGQTIPGFAVIAFFIGIVGIGTRPAILALWIYALLPILNNTIVGINGVSPAIIDSARGMGITSTRILFKVELPLAMSVIMAGIRTAVVIIVAMAVIAAFGGGGGLGDIIITGKNINRWQVLLLGAGYATLMAVLLEHVIGLIERMLTQ